jgi:hypothetical protein
MGAQGTGRWFTPWNQLYLLNVTIKDAGGYISGYKDGYSYDIN